MMFASRDSLGCCRCRWCTARQVTRGNRLIVGVLSDKTTTLYKRAPVMTEQVDSRDVPRGTDYKLYQVVLGYFAIKALFECASLRACSCARVLA